MQWWLICRMTALSAGRRLAKAIAAFPLGLILVIAGLILVWKGLDVARQQLGRILPLVSEAQRFSAAVNLFSMLALSSFILYYVMISLAADARRTWPALAASPIRYSTIWLGANSLALGGMTAGLFLLAFPLAMAFRDACQMPSAGQVAALGPCRPPSILLIALATLLTVVQSGLLGLWAWGGGRWLDSLSARSGFLRLLRPLLQLAWLLLLAAVLVLPLPMPEVLLPGHPGLSMGEVLVRSFAGWRALLWQGVVAVLLGVGAGFLLNHQPETLPSPSRLRGFSRHGTFGGLGLQIVVNTAKRFWRQPSMVWSHVPIWGGMVLTAFAMGRTPVMQPVTVFLVEWVVPYLSVSVPLLALGQDLPVEWVFRSAPLRRITYLILLQVGAGVFSFTIAMITAFLCILSSRVPMPSFEYWYLLGTQILGLSGVAFAVGSITRIRPGDASGQLGAGSGFFLLAVILQYGVGKLTAAWEEQMVWLTGLVWLAFFCIAPWIVLGWETWFLQRESDCNDGGEALDPQMAE